ncbi:hypothetical protein SLEP1_g8689 [Rubroshorea leprosula]|uniref:Protein unc-13 homolog n=1 Tax=Rubroshorea leprosula TaxID=152421 RepID=A0AAV5IAF0_9ROSI|nr:hypothetical protein SLEP1_g8689 [Rubroshorea leprosula]
MELDSLLQRYRRDRTKLLEFLLSSGLVKEIRTSSGPTASVSDLDVDSISADYILQCLKSGGIVDVHEATKSHYAESAYPIMVQSKFRDSYYLTSDPGSAGSPPRRVPPPIHVSQTANHASSSSSQKDPLNAKNKISEDNFAFTHKASRGVPLKPVENAGIPLLRLPSLRTGLSDDDLRESAYELLLASMSYSGVEVYSVEDRKKEKSSKILSGLRSKRDKTHLQSPSSERHSELTDTIRVQMQISEALDQCIRRNMVQLAARRTCGQIDLPQISLELLIGIFKSDFLNEKYYVQWKRRQANILEEFLCFSAQLMTIDRRTTRSCLAKIKDTKEWDDNMSPSQRIEVLSSIRQVASKLSSLPGQFGIPRETQYWTAAYHLNIRLYEKLLYGLFDILDEGQLIEEADAIFSLIKLTWSTLGITKKMHNALYGWVLFQQFVSTEEGMLLEHAIRELQCALSPLEVDEKEEQYMNSLVCLREFKGGERKLNLVQGISLSVGTWCDIKLQNYHLHFSQKSSNFGRKSSNFGRVMALASLVGILGSGDCAEAKLNKMNALDDRANRKIKKYVKRSIEAALRRVTDTILEYKVERAHPLALLANELTLLAEKELNVFFPVLRQWCPESVRISAKLLHQFYGEKLVPFLGGVSSLSEDVRSVFPAAYMLDHTLSQLYTSSLEDSTLRHSVSQDLGHYQIEKALGPILLDWLIGQHAHIMEWTGRALDIEDWEPLSFHQKQAASIIEVFRIIEETVDQSFGLKLPVDITHLQALLSIVYHSLDGYLQRMLNELVEKNHLYPLAPPLTRYGETIIPMIKKRLNECKALDDNVLKKLNELTVPRLCIKLNTVQFIQKQLGLLEDGIRSSWANVTPSLNKKCYGEEPEESLESGSLTQNEAVDELFDTTFNSIRDTIGNVTKKISDLIGTRVVFWDLRDTFLFLLYRGSVESARLDCFLSHIDTVLDHICSLVDDAVRDLVVLSIFKASLEGFVWVLLNGGPSRAFSDSDVIMMEEDLNILKEFFIAEGEGLPRSLVEREAKFAVQILSLFSLQSESIVQMLMSASEHISVGSDLHNHGRLQLEDAQTLVRVLCHKKDGEASKFLKRQYQLPMSSEYDDSPSSDSTLRSTLTSDLLKGGTSFQWSKKSQSSFKSFKKKLQEATSEIRNMAI